MTAVLDVRALPTPIVQTGMGAVARHEFVAAVSEAGGLGAIGGARGRIADELAAERKLTGRPIAVNLVLPLLRPGDVRSAAGADVIVTFWGEPRRLAGGTWVHQCGSPREAQAAEAAGADAVIAQGVEAGGGLAGSGASTGSPRRSCCASRKGSKIAGWRSSAHRSRFSVRRWLWTMAPGVSWMRGRLYAGANVTRISDVLPAARVVRDLTP